jgi:Tfp pilus assembly protein PilV
MRRRGFTLLELTIYMFLFLLLGFCAMQLFTLGRGAQSSTISSYVVSGQTDTAMRWLRRDFQETALPAVRVYQNPPGCALVSARDSSEIDNSQLNVSPYGAPLWTKEVFYTLVVPGGGRTGQLVRWERALTAAEKDFVPRAPASLPSFIPAGTKTQRVLLHTALAPNTKVGPLSGAPAYQSDEYGGFKVQFVRKDDTLTPDNPGDTSKPHDNAENRALVEVQLTLLSSDNSRPTMYVVKMRMHPRY